MVELAAAGHGSAAAGEPAAAVAGAHEPVQRRGRPVAGALAGGVQAGAGAGGAAQPGQVGERDQRAGERVGEGDAGPVGQPATGGAAQQVGQVVPGLLGGGGQRGQRVGCSADPAGG